MSPRLKSSTMLWRRFFTNSSPLSSFLLTMEIDRNILSTPLSSSSNETSLSNQALTHSSFNAFILRCCLTCINCNDLSLRTTSEVADSIHDCNVISSDQTFQTSDLALSRFYELMMDVRIKTRRMIMPAKIGPIV